MIGKSGRDDVSLADFSRTQREQWHPRRGPGRASAALATLVLFGLCVVIAGMRSLWIKPFTPLPLEAAAELLPQTSARIPLAPIPIVSHMIRPKLQDVAPPQFNVQPENTATQASLSATATPAPSPLAGAQSQAAQGLLASASGNNGDASPTAGCLDAEWVRAVNARIAGAFHYPGRAQRLGITGQVSLNFTVKNDGFFSALELSNPSGSYTLDTSAVSMMRAAQPLPSIPARMHMPRVSGVLVILFSQQSAGSATPLLTCN